MAAAGGFGGVGGGGGADEGIDPSADALLSAFNIYTKADGFYRDRFDGTREPQLLIMDDVSFGNPTKAEDADVYVITKSTFRDFPDLYLTDPDFQRMEKISNANPQQESTAGARKSWWNGSPTTASRSRAFSSSPTASTRRRSTP